KKRKKEKKTRKAAGAGCEHSHQPVILRWCDSESETEENCTAYEQRTKQNHLLDGRRWEVLRQKAGHKGHLSLLLLRSKDRGHRSQRLGQKLAASNYRRRRQRVCWRDGDFTRIHNRFSRA